LRPGATGRGGRVAAAALGTVGGVALAGGSVVSAEVEGAGGAAAAAAAATVELGGEDAEGGPDEAVGGAEVVQGRRLSAAMAAASTGMARSMTSALLRG